MHTQTLQRLRAELESASTLHLAMGRIATRANPAAPTAWTGPLLEELEDLTDDDGGFSQAGVAEIRRRSGAALIAQFHAVRAAIDAAPAAARKSLQALLDATLVTGTGNAAIATAAIPTVLSGLVKSGELRLDYTMRAAMLARDGLATDQPAPKKPAKKATAKKTKKPAAKAKKPAPKKAAKKPAPKKKPAKKPAAKKKPTGKKK
ncbi:MAG: hypothetical protein JNM69_08855 [Archangium sp.]|nr:hypothetical protein [Archangium sp.]